MATFQTPRIVVEQSPWQTFFEELPGMFATYQKTKLHAEEAERARQFARDNMYIKNEMNKDLMYEKAIIALQDKAIDKGVTMDINFGKNEVSSPAHSTRGGGKMNEVLQKDIIQAPVRNAKYEHAAVLDNLKLITQGQSDAEVIDINYDGDIDTAEIGTFQNSPEGQQLLKALDLTELPEPYLTGARAYLDQPKVKKSRKALFDLTNMLGAHVKDTEPGTPGLQFDPSDPRAIEIENTLNMIQLQQVPAAAAALKKVIGAKDPFARKPYGGLETTLLESQGMIVKKDPRIGDTVKRIDPATGDTLDVSPQEAAQTITTQKNINRQLQLHQDQIKITEVAEKQEKESFEGVQDARYEAAHTFMESGPLSTSRSKKSGKYTEGTPKWVKKIFDESDVLYTLLKNKSWHPTASGKHKSPEAIKKYQSHIEAYIVEIMTKGGIDDYDPDSNLQTVFDRGATHEQGARNVLNSPTFKQAVDPMGDGAYSKKEASKNLNELFDFHGIAQLRGLAGFDEASLAQGEAIAHLYSIWQGLELERIRRKRVEMGKIDQQRIRDKIISGQ